MMSVYTKRVCVRSVQLTVVEFNSSVFNLEAAQATAVIADVRFKRHKQSVVAGKYGIRRCVTTKCTQPL